MTASHTDFVNNTAQRGGAVHVDGYGTAKFSATRFVRNAAHDANGGGALDVQRGSVDFEEACSLVDNTAASQTQSLWIVSGQRVKYSLPAPLGFWVDSLGKISAELAEGATANYPLSCPPGMKGGSNEVESQTSALCDG